MVTKDQYQRDKRIGIGVPLSENELCPDELLQQQKEAFARDIARLQARRAEFVKVACPACGGCGGGLAFAKWGFSFERCPACKTLYMNPRPSESAMTDYYAASENYAFWASHIFPASEAARREKIHRPRLDRVLSYCEEFQIDRGTLLEVGPGFGTFAALAGEAGAFERVIAVEPTPELADACRRRGITVIEQRVEDLTEPLTANVVVAFELIEHLFEPRRFLEMIHPLLVRRGLLALSCPNGEGFDIAMLGPKALAVDVEHVNLFNPESLKCLLESCGFRVVKSQTPGRLDAELVRAAAIKGEIALDPFLQRVLVDDWDEQGWPFQKFLAERGLSSHMWVAACRSS